MCSTMPAKKGRQKGGKGGIKAQASQVGKGKGKTYMGPMSQPGKIREGFDCAPSDLSKLGQAHLKKLFYVNTTFIPSLPPDAGCTKTRGVNATYTNKRRTMSDVQVAEEVKEAKKTSEAPKSKSPSTPIAKSPSPPKAAAATTSPATPSAKKKLTLDLPLEKRLVFVPASHRAHSQSGALEEADLERGNAYDCVQSFQHVLGAGRCEIVKKVLRAFIACASPGFAARIAEQEGSTFAEFLLHTNPKDVEVLLRDEASGNETDEELVALSQWDGEEKECLRGFASMTKGLSVEFLLGECNEVLSGENILTQPVIGKVSAEDPADIPVPQLRLPSGAAAGSGVPVACWLRTSHVIPQDKQLAELLGTSATNSGFGLIRKIAPKPELTQSMAGGVAFEYVRMRSV
jgi:hypothetical protein